MSWRDELRRVNIGGRQVIGASFRGVPFFVDAADRGGGRRAVVHEFPLRDDPYVEDLGRKARSFRIDGYVIGDDYLAQRDALLSALEDASGPGELVHPYYGLLRAVCVSLSVREMRAEGAMATFSLEFAEAPAQAATPSTIVDEAQQISTSADDAIETINVEFEKKFNPLEMPSFALASAEKALAKAAAKLQEKLAPAVTLEQELASMAGRVALLTAQAPSMIRAPSSIVEDFRSVITDLVETVDAAPGAIRDALLEAYEEMKDIAVTVLETTTTRQREAANQRAIIGALQMVAVVESARLAPRGPYRSVEEAEMRRQQIADALEEQAATAGDDAYPALVQLRSDVLRAVPGGRVLAREAEVVQPSPVPSLVLAYQVHGSVDREQEIIERNSIRHPGFVAGTVKVLSDA